MKRSSSSKNSFVRKTNSRGTDGLVLSTGARCLSEVKKVKVTTEGMTRMEAGVKDKLNDLFSQHSPRIDELIPILQEAQERFGYLPEEVMQVIAKFLHISPSIVFGVASFYARFKFAPVGKRIVTVCRGTACHVRGGARILREVERRLGIKPGGTTKDWEYSLETAACIGACALAPNITIDGELHGQMTTRKVTETFRERSKVE